MSTDPNRFIVITGGAGAGKTTLVERLAAAGYPVKGEAGRAIIQDQVAISGPALPWLDPLLFAELGLSWELQAYRDMSVRAAAGTGPVFFDRSVVELAGYYPMLGRPLPGHVRRAVQRYRHNLLVFIAPPWREIFCTDTERRQTFTEAEQGFEILSRTYPAYGYELVRLPLASVDERVDFVLDRVG